VGALKILVPLADLIDVDAELERLNKEIQKIINEIARIEGKLANQAFVSNAPTEIVSKEKAKVSDYQTAKTDLERQKLRIQSLR
jgi:valyl-tRNA synthetase